MKAGDLPKGKLIKTSGIGSFKNKLSRGIHTTGELHTLHDNEKAVEKLDQIVSSQKRYIRGRGLSGYQIRKDVNEIKSADENFTTTDKRVVKNILKGMSTESYTKAGSEENKAATHGQFVYKRNINPATRNNNEHAITSIAEKFNTATVRRSGDATKLTAQGQERAHTFGSINSAIKNKPASNLKNEDNKPNQALSSTLKPIIK